MINYSLDDLIIIVWCIKEILLNIYVLEKLKNTINKGGIFISKI